MSHEHSKSDEKLCILLGTSITEKVDGPLMSKGCRTVINCSMSGATIHDIGVMAEDFFYENPQSVNSVDKIILQLGTNDIKWFNGRKYGVFKRFRPYLVHLVKHLKLMFPHAQITFVTVLPIRVVYNYTAESVLQFNDLLYEVCENLGCIFFDCFSQFLDEYGNNYNKYLYRDNWHLNDTGLKLLCRALKYLVYSNLYNPLPRTKWYPKFHY